jgi:hypothetical protein
LPPSGPPPPYNQPLPSLPQNASFKGNVSQQSLGDSGRETPPPGKGREDLTDVDVRALAQKHEELRRSTRGQHHFTIPVVRLLTLLSRGQISKGEEVLF